MQLRKKKKKIKEERVPKSNDENVRKRKRIAKRVPCAMAMIMCWGIYFLFIFLKIVKHLFFHIILNG